jgi:hypothetical protein
MQQEQQQWGMRDTTNLFYVLVNAHATAIAVFLRHSFGKEALAWNAVFALVLILVVGGFTGSAAMFIYLAAFLAALACQRLCTFNLVRKGVVWHTRYEGWPEIGFRLALGNVKAAVFVIEPLVCACVGGMLIDLGEAVVGWFVLCGTPSLLIREAVHSMIDQRRLDVMRDAQIEQEHLARQYRNQGQ